MGFASGPVSFCRYYLCGDHPENLTEEWVEMLAAHAFGKHADETSDGVETGWIVPTHLFDVDFSESGRIEVGRFVYLAMRMDRTAPPSAVVQSYRKMEEEGALRASGREFLTRVERRMAREAAADRAGKEARAGAFRRMAAYPVLIDLRDGVVYFGNLGSTAGDKLISLFRDTFDVTLMPAHVEELSHRLADRSGRTAAFDNVKPCHLVTPPLDASQNGQHSGNDRSFLGREFLSWLWYRCEAREGVFEIAGIGGLTLAVHEGMRMECPFECTGKVSITADAPGRSPEARAANAIGKMPSKMGFLMAAGAEEWAFTLECPEGKVSKLTLPKSDGEDPAGELEERFGGLRRAGELLDGLVAEFLRLRLDSGWETEVASMRKWATIPSRSKGRSVELVSA